MGHTVEHPPMRAFDEFRLRALAIEREATDRYREFSAWFAERDMADLASVCGKFAKGHRDGYLKLADASSAIAASAIDAVRHPWIQRDAPQSEPDEFFYRLASARQLLEIARAAENEGACFFEQAARDSGGGPAIALAAELASKARQAARELATAIEGASPVDWEQVIASGGGPSLALGAERRLRRGPPRAKE